MSDTTDGIAAAASTFKSLTSAMDDFFDRWNCYRTWDKRWFIQGKKDGQDHEVDAETLIEAMEFALDWKPLPLVPNAPERLCREAFTAVKQSGRWVAKYEGRDFYATFKTKREAELFFDRITQKRAMEYDEWHDKYAWCLHKQEGVDFRWAT